MARTVRLGGILVCLLSIFHGSARATLPEAPPASLGFDGERLKRIDAAIDRAISEGKVEGAVVLVGRRGRIAYVRAAGRRCSSQHPRR